MATAAKWCLSEGRAFEQHLCDGETCPGQLSRARLAPGMLSSPRAQLLRQIVKERKKYYLGEGAAGGRGSDLPRAMCWSKRAAPPLPILCPVLQMPPHNFLPFKGLLRAPPSAEVHLVISAAICTGPSANPPGSTSSLLLTHSRICSQGSGVALLASAVPPADRSRVGRVLPPALSCADHEVVWKKMICQGQG